MGDRSGIMVSMWVGISERESVGRLARRPRPGAWAGSSIEVGCRSLDKGVGNVIDVIDRVQLTGLGMFGTFTGYRMKPGVLAFHDTHMQVCGTLALLLRRE